MARAISTVKRAARVTANVISFLLGSVALTLMTAMFLLDHITVGQLFPFILPGIFLGWCVFWALLQAWGKKHQQQKSGRLSRKQLLLLGGLTLAVIGFAATLGTQQYFDDRSLLHDSQEYFTVTAVGSVSQDKIDRTLTELTRPIPDLRGLLAGQGNISKIPVVLFENHSSLIAATGLPDWSVGATDVGLGRGAIYLVAEESTNWFSNNRPTESPAHEATHALLFQYLGWQGFHNIPLWFHEGLAQYESAQGRLRFVERVTNRVMLWLNRTNIMNASEFCSYVPDDSGKTLSIFYSTSYEVVRSLAEKKGGNAIASIVSQVRQGIDFDSAFLSVSGDTCELFYDEWRKQF